MCALLCRTASAAVFDALAPFGIVEKASIDEAYLDVTKQALELRQQLADLEAGDAQGWEAAFPSPEASGSAVYGALNPQREADLLLLFGAQVSIRGSKLSTLNRKADLLLVLIAEVCMRGVMCWRQRTLGFRV